MASSGLLLMLLVLSSFLICSLTVPQPSDHQENRALQKRGKKLQTLFEFVMKIATGAKPFIGIIHDNGKYFTAFIDFAKKVFGANPEQQMLDFLKLKFDELNAKIDENQKKTEWNIWSSSAYGKLEKKITVAWNKLAELLKNCKEACMDSLKKDGKDKTIEEYFNKAEKYVDELHYHIVNGKDGYNAEYEKLLKDHVRCHERRLKIYSAINALLVYKAIRMTHFYKRFNNIKTDEDILANKAHEISAAMFNIQKNCISDPDPFVKLDVGDRIDKSVKRNVLVREIRNLDKTYDRYDWMVVAFTTKYSNYKKIFAKWLNLHILTGFTVVGKGKISVAVAKQAKGNHKKTAQVKEVIKECYDKTVTCNKVKAQLEKCAKDVNGTKVKVTYTAIHAYINKKHDSVQALDAEEAQTEEYFDSEEKQKIPSIYTGKCSILSLIGKVDILSIGHFRVLIKSDEELMKEDPCKKVDCGGEKRGKCVPLKNVGIGLCECTKEYYGESCEESLEDYKKKMFTVK